MQFPWLTSLVAVIAFMVQAFVQGDNSTGWILVGVLILLLLEGAAE